MVYYVRLYLWGHRRCNTDDDALQRAGAGEIVYVEPHYAGNAPFDIFVKKQKKISAVTVESDIFLRGLLNL